MCRVRLREKKKIGGKKERWMKKRGGREREVMDEERWKRKRGKEGREVEEKDRWIKKRGRRN